jgi:DNA-binding NarL/FixJ family response regulator
LVDDHPIVRAGVTQLINREPDLMVCGDSEEMHVALQQSMLLSPTF